MSTIPVNSSVQLTSSTTPTMIGKGTVGGPVYAEEPFGRPFGMAAQPVGTAKSVQAAGENHDLIGPVQFPAPNAPISPKETVMPMPSALLSGGGRPGGFAGHGK